MRTDVGVPLGWACRGRLGILGREVMPPHTGLESCLHRERQVGSV